MTTSYVNSVQNFSIAISSATSGTATISAINGTGFLVMGGFTCTNTGQNASISSPRLSWSGTTVTATLNSSGSGTVYGCIIDATSNLVTGVQAGTITISSGISNTATISSVSTTLSAVFFLGATSTATTQNVYSTFNYVRLALTNATTVTATLNTSSTVTASYVVVTFAAGAINSNIQQLSTTKSSGTSNTQTITSVTAANTMLAWGGCTTTSNNGGAVVPYIGLTNSTTVTLTSNATSGYTCNFTVIEFVSGVLTQSSQYSSISMTSQTSNTATITSAATATTVCAFLGGLCSEAGSSNDNTVLAGVNQTNATTVTAFVNTSSTNTTAVGFEVLTFTNVVSGGLFPFLMYDDNTSANMQALSGGMRG